MKDRSRYSLGVSENVISGLPTTVRKVTASTLVCGVLLMMVGLFAVFNSVYASVMTVGVIGGVLLVGGLVQAVQAILSRRWKSFLVHMLMAVLYVVAGVMVFNNPVATALSLSLLIASFLVVGGIFKIVASASIHFEQWGWTAFSGLTSIALGVLIFAQWPSSALWILGVIVGVELFFMGVSLAAVAFASRREIASWDESPQGA